MLVKSPLSIALLLYAVTNHLLVEASDKQANSDLNHEITPQAKLPAISPHDSSKSLSLNQFLKIVDSNYPKLQGADLEKRIASAKRLEKSGAFDPVWNHISEYLRVQDTVTPGKAKDAVHNESRADLLTRSGIKVFAGMRLNPNDTKTPFVPSGKSGEYFAGVSVPLLRGLRINEKSAAEQQAKLGEPLSIQLYGLTRLEVLLKASAVYWDWIGARTRIEISKSLLKIAVDRVEQIKKRVTKGDLPSLDIAESEQEIQRRQAALVKSERDFQKSSIFVSVFLWDEKGSPRSMPGIEEVPPLPGEPARLEEKEWLEGRKSALDLRPELKRITLEKEQAKVDLRLAENMILPAMDMYLTQGADTGPEGIGHIMRGGIAMSVPLRQRTARGQGEAARLKIQKLNLDEKLERLRIQAEVDDTVSAINTSYDRWAATLLEVNKAKQVETGERLRFSAGDSTLFLVNQRERARAEAQMRLVETQVDYFQALTAFKIVTCRL